MLEMRVARAVGAGLRFRPLEETARDTLAWAGETTHPLVAGAGLEPAREAELLEAWRAV
jgi:2'-hydroxyisoflavone reductase